jgi:hypothetical protein
VIGPYVASIENEEEVSMSKRSWKNERASVSRKSAPRPRSNKYSRSDQTTRPQAGERSRVWVGGYTRSDGTKVSGHYREQQQEQ